MGTRLRIVASALCATALGSFAGWLSAAEVGAFTKAQADAGSRVYTSHCARCHGARLEGGMGPPLAGEAFVRTLDVDSTTAPQLYDFITSHMPRHQAGILTDQQYLRAFAFILSANGYPSGQKALTKQTLNTVELRPYPGRGGRST